MHACLYIMCVMDKFVYNIDMNVSTIIIIVHMHSCQQSTFFLDCPGNEHLVQVSRKAGNLSRITTWKLESQL